MKALIILSFIVPFVMILLGFLFKKHPVTDMSRQQGYNTPTSRKSQAHWDYAQSIAPDIFLSFGKITLVCIFILDIIFLIMNVNIEIPVYLGSALGFVFIILAFIKTEHQIKMKFPEL